MSALQFKHACDKDNDKAEQLTTPGRRTIPRPWALRGRTLAPETQLAGCHVPSPGADWAWSQTRGKRRPWERVHAGLPASPQGASGQSYQAAGQPTCASLQCEALKLWHLCRAQSQAPGRAPRTTFSKSSVHTAVVGSRRQEWETGEIKGLLRRGTN